MQKTLTIPIFSNRRENRLKERPLRRLIIFLAVLIGVSIAIAAHSKKEPHRFVSMT